MKRILSITLLALAIIPAVVNANSRAFPVIKIKSSGTTIFSGSQPQADHNLTISEGSSVTLTVQLDGRGTSHFQRRVRLLQNFITVPPWPTNTHNPDVLIDAGTRDTFTTSNPDRFGYKANNARIMFSTSNWNQPVDVVITAKQDDDAIDDTFRIQIPTSIGYLYINGTVTDDDSNELVIEEPTSKSLVMNEGQSKNFKLKLGAQPDGDVSVRVSAPSRSNLAISGDVTSPVNSTDSFVSFNRSNWNTAKTVTVTGTAESDIRDRTATIQLTGQSGSNYSGISENVSVKVYKAIRADRNRNFLIADEGTSTSQFQYWLTSRPPADRTIAVSTTHDDLKVFTGTNTPSRNITLTFTPANWQTRQIIKVAAAQDDDALDADHFISFTMGNGLINGKSYRLRARIQDDDVMLDVSGSTLSVDEGESETVNVKLESEPSHDRTVKLTSSNSNITVSPSSMTFTRSNWGTNQVVTVSAPEDSNTVNETATLTIGANGVRSETVSVTTVDDDVNLELSASSVDVDEGGTGTFTVRLESAPNSNVTVNLASDNTAAATLSPATLSFTSGNYSAAQTVTVTGVQDDDATDETADIELTGTGVTAQTVSVAVTDDDEDTLEISPMSQTIREGEGGSFTVSLAARPNAGRTVTLASNNDDLTVSPTTLTFSTTDYNTPQTVTITTEVDSDAASEDVTISLTGDDFENGEATVRISDDDEVDLTLSKSVVSLGEGTTTTFTVRLAEEPGATRTVTLASSDTAVVTLSDASLEFTASNYSTAQEVTVTAVQDSGTASNTATITLGGTGISGDSLPVTVTDDDPVELVLSDATLSVVESRSGIITVRLKSEPAVDRTVSLASSDTAAVTVSPASLDFTTDNWGDIQTVTLSAESDSDLDNDSATINLTGAGVTADSVEVTVIDDDVDLTLSALSVDVNEGGIARFSVSLATQPQSDIRVVLTQPVNTDVTIDKTELQFTRDNWNSPQTVTVSVAHDGDSADETASIPLDASGNSGAGSGKTVTVNVKDDDQPGLMLSTDSLTMSEGDSGSFRVSLRTQPSGNVTVMLTEPGDLMLDKTELLFSASNWDVTQTVRVTADEDDDSADDKADIQVSTSGSYGAFSKEVKVTVTDNDPAALTLSTISLTVLEGTSKTFEVRPKTRPTEDVRVTLTQPSNTDVKVDTDTGTDGDQTELTFTASDWQTAQSVTVRVAQDGDTDDDGSVGVDLSAEGGPYDGVTASVELTVKDDDVPRLDISPGTLTVNEEGSGSFEVKLGAGPNTGDEVTVTLTQPSNTDVTVDTDTAADGNQTELTFTDQNWQDPQTVTVRATADADTANDTALVALSAAGGGYRDISGSLLVSVTDNDDVGLALSESDLSITEEGSKEFKVRLTSQPSGNRRVSLAWDNTDIVVSPTSLDFTVSDWNTDQTVVVSAGDDADKTDDTATITLSGTGITQGTLEVTVVDDDIGVMLSTNSLTIDEGSGASLGAGTFTVQLDAQPSRDRTIELEWESDDVNAILLQTQLDFTPDNWNQPVIVTIRITDLDPDLLDDTATVSLTSGGKEVAEVDVTIRDNAEVALYLSETSLTIVEGKEDTFTVRLFNQPAKDVTLALKPKDENNDAISISPASLVFTAGTGGNWGTEQTVTVTGEQDTDVDDDAAVISITGAGVTDMTDAVSVSIPDDDAAVIDMELSKTSLMIAEGGSDTFTVRLQSDPGREVSVALASSNDEVTLDPTSLTFTSANWSTAQTVTATAEHDNDNDDDSATISLTGRSVTNATVSATVSDDEKIGLTLAPATSLTVAENGRASFTVRLEEQPDANQTVTLTSSDTGKVTVDTDPDTAGNQTTLSFTAGSDGDWNIPQTVMVMGVDDSDKEDDDAIIRLAGAGDDTEVATASLSVKVEDDDRGATLEQEKEGAAVILAEVVGALLPAAGDTIALRFDAAPGGRFATVAGRQIALDRSLARDLAAGFAERAGVRDPSQSRYADGRFGAERHSAEWLGGIPLDAGRPLGSTDERASGMSGQSSLLSAFSYALGADGDGGGSGWSIWGRFDTGEFSGSNDGVEFDSSRSSLWLGADRRTDSGLLSGVAYSSSGSDADYTLGKFGAALETDLTLVLPYIRGQFDGGATGHAMLGIGSGQATITQTTGIEGRADLSMYMLAAGGSWPTAWEIGSAELSWSGDFGYTALSASGSDVASLNGLSVSSMQLRGGMELTFEDMGDGLKAAPRAALLMRLDAGDGVTGTGFELTGGMQVSSAASDRFSLDVNLRTLLMHSAEELTDWGMSIQFRFSPRSDGGGLEFAAGPHWGAPEGDGLLERDEAFRIDEAGRQHRQLRGRERGLAGSLGYGLRAFGGLLTPYSEYRFTSGDSGSIRQVAGVRFRAGETLRMSLFSERHIARLGEPRSRLAVELQKRY